MVAVILERLRFVRRIVAHAPPLLGVVIAMSELYWNSSAPISFILTLAGVPLAVDFGRRNGERAIRGNASSVVAPVFERIEVTAVFLREVLKSEVVLNAISLNPVGLWIAVWF